MSNQSRVMVFVDGTNFLLRLADEIAIEFRADKPPDIVIELTEALIRHGVNPVRAREWDNVIRQYWFGSYQGSESFQEHLSSLLRHYRLEPVLFKKRKGREKGVDIALTKEMLVNAFNQNFDIGILFAGDEDYVGLVNEVKRYGPRIYGAFFENGLSNALRLSFDRFFRLPNITGTSHLNTIYLRIVTEFQHKHKA